MKQIIIASKNPVKVNAALLGFEAVFPEERFEAEGVSVPSGVSDQPNTNSETYEGACNRARRAHELYPDADYCVGIEGGLEEIHGEMEVFAWIVIEGKDGLFGKGRTSTFFLPPALTALVQNGMELGSADDAFFGREGGKQTNGTIGMLTGDVVDRTRYYVEAMIMALIPFKNENLYRQ